MPVPFCHTVVKFRLKAWIIKIISTETLGEYGNKIMSDVKQTDQFLEDIKSDSVVIDDKALADIFDKPKETPKVEETKSEEDEEDKPKTRRYKRLEKKNEEMGQMLVEMNERIKQLSEVDRFARENPELDPLELKVLGTDENGKLIKSYLDKRFTEVREQTRKETLAEIKELESRASEAEAKESAIIDQAFDNLEDKFNVDLSGKTKASKDFRNGFIDFIEQISPKDSKGEITEYADFPAAFETYSKIASNTKSRETSERQKELASRGMTRSGTAAPEPRKGRMTFNTIHNMIDSFREQ